MAPTSRIASVSSTSSRPRTLRKTDASANRPESSALTVVDELTASLRFAGITDPRRIANDIIAALLDVPRSWAVMNREAPIDAGTVAAARSAAMQLGSGAPFAYAVGSAPFRHLTLKVDMRVLIPRPETEVLVGAVLDKMETQFGAAGWGTAIDIGTGCGAIALSLASEGRFDNVIATDASLDALEVARINAEHCAASLKISVELRHGSLLSPVRGVNASVVISNPPYIAFSETESLPPSVRDWEPPLALLSGHDGMAATAAIIRDAVLVLNRGGLLAIEVDERRASLVAEIAMAHGGYEDVNAGLDLAGRERFVIARRI